MDVRTETMLGRPAKFPRSQYTMGVDLGQAMLHSAELQIVETLADAGALVKELHDFRVQFTGAGSAVFNARQGAHDDLILAVAIALWHGAKPAVGITVRRVSGF